MKLKQFTGNTSTQPASKPSAPPFPSARYFQVHFDHLQQVIKELGEKLEVVQQEVAELRKDISASKPEVDRAEPFGRQPQSPMQLVQDSDVMP